MAALEIEDTSSEGSGAVAEVSYIAKHTIALQGLSTPDSCDWSKALSRD